MREKIYSIISLCFVLTSIFLVNTYSRRPSSIYSYKYKHIITNENPTIYIPIFLSSKDNPFESDELQFELEYSNGFIPLKYDKTAYVGQTFLEQKKFDLFVIKYTLASSFDGEEEAKLVSKGSSTILSIDIGLISKKEEFNTSDLIINDEDSLYNSLNLAHSNKNSISLDNIDVKPYNLKEKLEESNKLVKTFETKGNNSKVIIYISNPLGSMSKYFKDLIEVEYFGKLN